MLEKASRVKRVEKIQFGGREAVEVKLEFGGIENGQGSAEVAIVFDPAVNFLVRKVTYDLMGGGHSYHRELQVNQFRQVAPGVFFPERIEGHATSDTGDIANNHSSVLSEIQVNGRLPDRTFKLTYPRNVTVLDEVRGVTYKTGADGNRISPERPIKKVTRPPAQGSGIPAGSLSESKTEPKSFARWILPLGIMALSFAGVIAIVRRRRALAG
jgi:hypothetical protein